MNRMSERETVGRLPFAADCCPCVAMGGGGGNNGSNLNHEDAHNMNHVLRQIRRY
jgi:hypothetical protein